VSESAHNKQEARSQAATVISSISSNHPIHISPACLGEEACSSTASQWPPALAAV